MAVLLAAPAGAEVSLKPHTDYKPIKRTALLIIPDAEGLTQSGVMVTDMIAHHLTQAGLPLLPRATQQLLLEEKNIEVSVHTPREKLQTIGKLLGVEAVIVGRLLVTTEGREAGTMSGQRKIIVRRNGRFVQVWKDPDLGPGGVQYFQIDGPCTVLLTVKMVKTEGGEVMWFLSSEERKRGFQQALRAALDPPMNEIVRAIRRSLEGYTYTPKQRKKWKGLDNDWRERHDRGRF